MNGLSLLQAIELRLLRVRDELSGTAFKAEALEYLVSCLYYKQERTLWSIVYV